MAYLLGYDIGSSSIKATLLDAETGNVIASAVSPETELEIIAKRPGWAEQEPYIWWDNLKSATAKIKSEAANAVADVEAIGISYQMHGLVVVDKNHKVLRPAIIWCDSRAVGIGERAFREMGQEVCFEHLLNSPGNFTASKLKWVMENEPEIYRKIDKAMLPGDYIAMMLTDEIKTTPSGLSEAILWDFKGDGLAEIVLKYYGISAGLIPELTPTFSIQGELTKKAAEELGLKPGTKLSYRAGDQPNNALSLNVLNPGEIAATAGTSGVVYGIDSKASYDAKSRVNTFVHVNHASDSPRYGALLCLNGCGILNSWLKHNFVNGMNYDQMNKLALQAPVGSEGLTILPFGNGAERTLHPAGTLENRDMGALVSGWKFNTHNKCHFLRAAQEGIVFALNYGLGIMRDMGVDVATVRAGNANMFLSPLFREAFATVTQANLELYNTDGSQGAARGAGIGVGIYKSSEDAFVGLKTIKAIEPNANLASAYQEAYGRWEDALKVELSRDDWWPCQPFS